MNLVPESRGRPGRFRQALVALSIAGLAALALGPAAALAASTTLSSPTSLSGAKTLTSLGFNLSSSLGVTATGTAAISAHWNQPASLGTVFDPNLVRQGRALNPSDSYTRTPTGTLTVDYTLQNLQVSWGSIGPLPLGSPTFSASGPCNLIAGGADYVCNLSSPQVDLLDTYPVPGPYVKLSLGAAVTISPLGINTIRTATFSGTAGGTNGLLLGETPITDGLFIPCTVGAGDELSYGLGPLKTTMGLSIKSSLVFDVGAELPNPLPPFDEIDISFDTPTLDLPGTTSGDIAMTGAGATFDMGAVQKNNIPPVVGAGGPYSGVEGSPVTFDGSGSSSVCGFPTLRWDFSDGGVAFGEFPQHTFQGHAVYSGQLTATDTTGLVSTTTFSIPIDNLAPVVTAGPDTTAAWGQPVAFNGSAVDPGADDQSTLTYSWVFGDGTPSATGGPSVFHSYAAPGDYLSTLSVCDQWVACSSNSRTVHVRTRAVTAAYLGDTTGTFDTAGTLTASLTDEFGQAVAGRSVSFTVNSGAAGSSTTGAGGSASVGFTPALVAGSYVTGVSFVGDGLYNPASAAGSISIVKKATSVTYTGAISGGPNKTVTLSAILRDATGKALSGRSITFKLGTQSVSATTGDTGVATTTLKLAQKNATYSLTATYTPTNTGTTPIDAGAYVGSSSSGSFSIGGKQ